MAVKSVRLSIGSIFPKDPGKIYFYCYQVAGHRQNDHKTIFPKKIFGSKKERDKTNPVCGKPPLAGSFKKVPIQKLIIKIFTDLPVLGTEPIKKRPLLDCLGDFPLIYLIGNIINFVKLKW